MKIKGLDELTKAIERNAQVVQAELNKFLVRGLAVYRAIIGNNPWRIGGAGGGAPIASGNLRDRAHIEEIRQNDARIYVSDSIAPYAIYVHEGTGTMTARPWLDYAQEKGDKDIQKLELDLLDAVVDKLSK